MLKTIRQAIGVMIAIHFALSGVLIYFRHDLYGSPWSALAVGLLFSQTALLGVLLGLGNQPLRIRLLEVLVGLGLPCGLIAICADSTSEIFGACAGLAVSTGIVAIWLQVLRRRGVALRTLDSGATSTVEGLQFTVRHLFYWGFATALLVRGGQLINPRSELGVVLSFGLAFGVGGISSPWAALGQQRVVLRCTVTILLAALVGVLLAVCREERRLSEMLFFSAPTATQATLVLASLSLLRPSGLRLVRIRPTEPNAEEAG